MKCFAFSLLLSLVSMVTVSGAVSISGVKTVNVRSGGFALVWSVAGASEPVISVYADAQGRTNLAGVAGIEWFPLMGGNTTDEGVYEKRELQKTTRAETKKAGLVMVQISGCKPLTQYYYRVGAKINGAIVAQWPDSGDLPGVRTAEANSFVIDSKQLLLTIPGVRTYGRIMTLSTTNAAYPLAAVVGDGADTNQVYFNLSEFMSKDGRTNYPGSLDERLLVEMLGPSLGQSTQTFYLAYSSNFVVGTAEERAFVLDSLTLTLSEDILYAGSNGFLGIYLKCNAAITNVTADLDLPLNRFTNFTVVPVAVPDGRVGLEGERTLHLNLRVDSHQTYAQPTLVARLAYQSVLDQISAIMPVRITGMTSIRPDGLPLASVLGYDSRIIVVGRQPILEALRGVDSPRSLMVYGREGMDYHIQSATGPESKSWPDYISVTLTNIAHRLDGLTPTNENRFYRASE
jgi:hypothetical protein